MRRRLTMAAVVIATISIVAVIAVVRNHSDGPAFVVATGAGRADYDYVIPAGTWQRVQAKETVEIVPRRLDVEVGESIRIRNEDDKGSNVGIFYIGLGETVRMRFTSSGELSSTCDVHPSGQFTIVVHEA